MVHDFPRSFAGCFEFLRGIVELRLGNRRLRRSGDDQNNFALRVGVTVQSRQLADTATLELLELLRQLPRPNRWTLRCARPRERFPGSPDAIGLLEHNHPSA